MNNHHTEFGSLNHYEKGGVQVIDDDPKHYVFSNVFEVASKSKPYEKVAVGKNLRYVLEAVRAEGISPWFAAAHDEAALVMDGEIEVGEFVDAAQGGRIPVLNPHDNSTLAEVSEATAAAISRCGRRPEGVSCVEAHGRRRTRASATEARRCD